MRARIPSEALPSVLVIAAAALFFLASTAHFANAPLRIEESEWPPMARAVIKHGKPVIAAGETHRVRFVPGSLDRDPNPLTGAWHPPLYLYTLGASMVVLGEEATYSLRAVGIGSLLLAAFLLALIAKEIAPRRWLGVSAGGLALLFLHPYASQGSTFLDIDTGIYAAPIMLLLYLAIRFGRHLERLGAGQLALLGAALAVVTWTKMTTAIVLVGVLGVWWIAARGPRRLPEIVAVVAIGAGLFFSTYALWCQATGIPFSYTFDATFGSKSGRLGNWALTRQAAQWHFAWFMPALLAMGALYGGDLARRLVRERRADGVDLLWLFAAAVLLLYGILSPTDGSYQGKYAFVALPALALSVAWLALRDGAGRPLALAAAAAAGLVGGALMPDLLTDYRLYLAPESERLWVALGSVAVLAVAAVAVRALGGRMLAGALVACVVLVGAQSVRSLGSDVSPMYPVSDRTEFEQAASLVNRLAGPGDIVFAAKDLAFYVQGPVIEGEDAFARGDASAAKVLSGVPTVRLVATTSFGPPMGPATAAMVERCFRQSHELGLIVIRVRRSSC